jgi:hypothetical protein
LTCEVHTSNPSNDEGYGAESEPPTVYADLYTGALYLDKPNEQRRNWAMDRQGLDWRKASYSNGSGNCVEVAGVASMVLVRDTKNRDGGTLTFTATAWQSFRDSFRSSPTTCARAGGPSSGLLLVSGLAQAG